MPTRPDSKEVKELIGYEIAKVLASKGAIKRCLQKTYMYNGLFYEPLNTDNMKYFIFDTAYKSGIILNERLCRFILKEVILRTPNYEGIMNDERYTLFQNGYVDNQTGQLVKIVPDYFPTMCVEANYFPDQPLQHPEMDKFLDSIAGGNPMLIQRLLETIGYCISSDAMAKRIFLLIGESGDNGKSTFLNVLSLLISSCGVIQMNITNLVKGWFSMNELSEKRIQVSADEGNMNLTTEQIAKLKSISGHDWITADVKHQSQIKFLSTTKILIASNNNIGAAYSVKDPAFSRRICSLPFDVKIPKEEQDPYLVQKLSAERDAIATHAFLEFLALKNRNYVFTGDGVYDKNFNMHPNNPLYHLITEFSKECCYFTPEAFTYTEDLYLTFISKYGETIFKDITAFSQAFFKANEAYITKRKKHTNQKNAWGFCGVTLRG